MSPLLLDGLMIATLAAVTARWWTVLIFALLDVAGRRRDPNRDTAPGSAPALAISVVVPAFNEERVIARALRAIAASQPAPLEILVVDDGSSDASAAVVDALMAELPGLRLLSHPTNRGKPAALNTGLAAARGELVVTVDADTLLEPTALRRLAAPFADPAVAAVAGNVKVGNRHTLLTTLQSIEYVTALNLDRRAQAWAGAITTSPGATSAWRRTAVLALGGFSADTLTEDTDLTLRVLRAGHAITFADRAASRTEAPLSWGALFRQRRRWLYGNLQNLWKHRRAFATLRPAALGWFGLPNFGFNQLGVFALLPLSLLYLPRALGLFPPAALAGIVAGLFLLDLLLAAVAYGIDGERKRELLAAPLQRLVMPFFAWVVLAAVAWRFARGRRPAWLPAERTGTVS